MSLTSLTLHVNSGPLICIAPLSETGLTIVNVSTISNIFEQVIHDQMYEYFNIFNLLAVQWYGFRNEHSTDYEAVKLIDHVSNEVVSI